MKFQFKCINCGMFFEEDICGEAVEVFLDAYEAGGKEIMQGTCSDCPSVTLDFLTPNVGYQDVEGKDVCGCCRTYHVVGKGELANINKKILKLYAAATEARDYLRFNKGNAAPIFDKLVEAIASLQQI